MEKKIATTRKLRWAPGTRKGKNLHSTGRQKEYINPRMMAKMIYGNPLYNTKRKKLKGWQKENRRRAA
jgi:hypothetical protein